MELQNSESKQHTKVSLRKSSLQGQSKNEETTLDISETLVLFCQDLGAWF